VSLHPDSSQLLQAIPAAIDGVRVSVIDGAGARSDVYGDEASRADQVRVGLPDGELVAELLASSPAHGLVASLFEVIAQRERLESDMESMNGASVRLLEQVSMMGETLPKLSGGVDDAEVAARGAHACRLAAGVERVIFLAGDARKESCEVVVHDAAEGAAEADSAAVQLGAMQPVEGLLREVLTARDAVLRSVPCDGSLGALGSAEHLARRQVLGVPVGYGSGEKRVTLGALLLIDRAYSSAADAALFDVELGSEEAQVAESFAAMIGAMLGAREVARLGKELNMAQTIQQQILPDGPICLDGFDVAADYFACGAVGGDYFDYVPLADGRTMVVVADVSGHNLASGMVMVGARAMLRTLATVHERPEDVFTQVARRMHDDLTRTERFLTAAAVALSPNSGVLDYVSAGHNDLMVYRAATGRVDRWASEDVIFGFLPSPEYRARQLTLTPGDCVLLYTDGVTEAVDQQDEMFGEERLAASFAALVEGRSAQQILDHLIAELDRFRCGQRPGDDITAVVIRCTHPGVSR